MTGRDDFSEALELAQRDEVTPEQVKRLALSLAPIYGAAIASGAASASASSSVAAGASSAASGTGVAGTAAASMIATKAIVATLTVAAIGAASFGALRSTTPATEAPRVAPMTAPARSAEPSAFEPGLEPPTSEPAPAVLEPSVNKKPARVAPRKNTPVEAQLLTQAHAALREQPAHALRLANEHRARFPHGALAQERELLAIRALERMGRTEQAATRRARALRELPGSVALERSGPLEP